MIRIMLGHSMPECPKWWENFIADLQQRLNCCGDDVPVPAINYALEKYGARCRYLPGLSTQVAIDFDSEQNYTLFTLRWL